MCVELGSSVVHSKKVAFFQQIKLVAWKVLAVLKSTRHVWRDLRRLPCVASLPLESNWIHDDLGQPGFDEFKKWTETDSITAVVRQGFNADSNDDFADQWKVLNCLLRPWRQLLKKLEHVSCSKSVCHQTKSPEVKSFLGTGFESRWRRKIK